MNATTAIAMTTKTSTRISAPSRSFLIMTLFPDDTSGCSLTKPDPSKRDHRHDQDQKGPGGEDWNRNRFNSAGWSEILQRHLELFAALRGFDQQLEAARHGIGGHLEQGTTLIIGRDLDLALAIDEHHAGRIAWRARANGLIDAGLAPLIPDFNDQHLLIGLVDRGFLVCTGDNPKLGGQRTGIAARVDPET